MGEDTILTFRAGDVTLASGTVLADVRLVYRVFGTLNATSDNAVVVPTHFGGTHEQSLYLIGADKALDPAKYFIIVVNLLGNGQSSSPSHGLGSHFPTVTIADNVRLQHRLLTRELGVTRLALVVGHSMGGVTAFHWAAMYPDLVARAAPICGAARISTHNYVFIEGMRGILTADPAWQDGAYTEQPRRGLRAMARAWAAWPPSAHFYRHALYKELGYVSLEDFLERYWEATYTHMDANNLLAQMSTWESADIGADPRYGGEFARALAAITARTFVIPCSSDAYFPPEDSAIEVAGMRNAELRTIESRWGHWAGSGRNPVDTVFIDRQLGELLASRAP